MSFENTGAVMLLEIRPPGTEGWDSRPRPEESLSRARLVLEAPGQGRTWTPASAPGVSGSVSFREASQALPLLHRLRTELRADPSWPRLAVVAGIGRGDEVEGARLAGEAFRGLGKRGRIQTRMLSGDARTDAVLAALCRTLDSLQTGWTRAQWQAVHRRDGGRTLQEIGGDLGIAYQNVSKRLIAARYGLYREVLEAANLLFTESVLASS